VDVIVRLGLAPELLVNMPSKVALERAGSFAEANGDEDATVSGRLVGVVASSVNRTAILGLDGTATVLRGDS
jgi:hypothetical protein